jgi:SAM-dependent methyltransferase
MHRVVPLRVRRPAGIAVFRVYRAGRNALREVLGRLPILKARDFVYDKGFYAKGDPMKLDSYPRFADALIRLRAPRTVIDVGSGSGLMLAEFAKRGVEVTGIEGSRAAIERSALGDRVIRANLERGVPDVGRFDLALCIEVAEHLSARSAPRLIEGLTRLSDVVVFTAGRPGEGGLLHVNEQPEPYWRALFERNGYVPSPLRRDLLAAIADVPEPRYLHENLMVFERDAR